MNENTLSQTTNEHDALQSIILSEVRQKISDAVTDAEDTSKEKLHSKAKIN